MKYFEILRDLTFSRIALAAACQRFGHYGIRSLLLVYLITHFGLHDRSAGQIYGLFYGSFFLTSLLGGLLGDTKLGYRWAGSLGISLMLVAQVLLAVGLLDGMLAALALYSIGFGLFNPNMNVAVSEHYQGNENLRGAAYTILYSAINLGAMLGPLVCGYIALRTSWRGGFLAGLPFSFIGLMSFGLSARSDKKSNISPDPDGCHAQRSEEELQSAVPRKTLVRVLVMLGLLSIVFAGVFDQLGSSVTLLVHRHVSRTFFSFQMPAGYVQSINPFLVILFGPWLSLMIKQGRLGSTKRSKMKILAWAFLLLGTGFLLLSIGSLRIGDPGTQAKVSWLWIIFAILLASFGELLFGPTSVSLVAGFAPQKRKGLAMGVWSATIGIGVYLSGSLSGLMSSSGRLAEFFAISAGGCLLGCVLLMMSLSRLFKHRMVAVNFDPPALS
ncbi:MAG: proton-dependent oligopeptide transporter, family [Blastocatellia bacterium]|jgi:POT family proton-dependent oligopeptide transporter|nr:proton-dependent oligopeptide transporter, family [Blastocatellia bacterium]